MTLQTYLHKVLDRRSLSREEAHDSFMILMRGEGTPVLTAAFLAALRVKGETVDEITGAAEAMRESAIPVTIKTKPILDTCGTGGDGRSTFNVSTAAAFVAAGAGFTVAKHGNRAISSACGSADVLESLGLPMETDAQRASASLEKIGLSFLFAPAFHPAMKHAMPIRKELGTRTLFNLLGPLANPVRPSSQLLGVFDAVWLKPVAESLQKLGCESAFVVHGQGEDEIVLHGTTEVVDLFQGRIKVETWRPEDFGFKTQPPEAQSKRNPVESARILMEVLNGRLGIHRNIVCMNAGAAIRAAARTKSGGNRQLSLKEAAILAQKSIDSRSAIDKYEKLKAFLSPEEASNG